MTASATLAPDRQTITLAQGTWSAVIPAADLSGWLALYRALADRPHPRTHAPAAWSARYAPMIAALEQVGRQIAASG